MEDISEKGIIHNKYIIKDTLGKGGFGKVYLVNEINTDKEYALKLLKKKDEKIEKKIEFIKIISSNKSRYITNMIDNGEGPFIKNGENKGNKQYIVYEYEPKGDLYDYFIYPNQPFLEEEFAKIIFKNILKGVQIIHKNKICHRDIKLENILLDKNFCPKICDFGFLIKTVEGRNLKGRCGTKGYMAPEMLNNDKNYKGYNGLEADIFSLGATLIKLVTGKELKELQEEYVKDIKMKSLLLVLLFTFAFTYSDLEALTRVVYCEARGEPDNGKLAVAYAVVNRHKKSGKSVAYEATKKYQFCVWSKNMSETAAAAKCKSAAQAAISGSKSDPSNGATFFYSGSSVPSWAIGKSPCATIGGHKFFKNIAPY